MQDKPQKATASIVLSLRNALKQYPEWSSQNLELLIEHTDEDIGLRIFQSFRQFLEASMKQFTANFGEEHTAAIAHAVHRLRPSSETMGFRTFAKICEELDVHHRQHGNYTDKSEILALWIKLGNEILTFTEAVAAAEPKQ